MGRQGVATALADVEERQSTPFANAQLIPTNFKIRYDVEVLRARLAWAVLQLEKTLGMAAAPLVLEPGYYSIDDVRELLDTEDELATLVKLRYKPGKAPGTFLVVGVVNHLLFDRRTTEFVLDPDCPLERIRAMSAAELKRLGTHYQDKLFFKRLVGGIGTFALTALDIAETKKAMMPQLLTVPRTEAQHDLYTLFYEMMGRSLQGAHLLFVVKDQYNTEFKKTGTVRAHSWYGFFVRAVSFPCSKEEFLAQVKDGSVPHEGLFKRKYRAAWTLNDHSSFATSNKNFALRDNEMYLSEGFSFNLLRWVGLMERAGPLGAGNFFFVSELKDKTYSVMIHRCHDPAKIRQRNILMGAAVVVGLGSLVAWYCSKRRQP
mmetsp:Transcript_33117/g.85897  ORF Transcript_33117/g.85897 Transcript_33117/m.85897 type:complete len:375 (+) Transcript_33117:224-1348(+)